MDINNASVSPQEPHQTLSNLFYVPENYEPKVDFRDEKVKHNKVVIRNLHRMLCERSLKELAILAMYNQSGLTRQDKVEFKQHMKELLDLIK